MIPDLCEPKKVKGRPTKPVSQTPVVKTTTSKAKQTRKAVLPSKSSGTKNSRTQGGGDKTAAEVRTKPSRARSTQNTEKKESHGETAKELRDSNAKGSEERAGVKLSREGNLTPEAGKSLCGEDTLGEDALSDNEVPPVELDDPLSSLQTETSNDSCRTDDSLSGAPTPSSEQQQMQTSREADPPYVNSDLPEKFQDSGPEDDEVDLDDEDSLSTNNDVIGDVDSDTDTRGNQTSAVSAKNLELGQDGKLVVVWTRLVTFIVGGGSTTSIAATS